MKKLVRNTVINIGALGIVSVISLLIVPFLIAGYGLEKYGLIVLARTLLPAGIMVLFDFGMSESVTKYVAHYDAKKNTKGASMVLKQAGLLVFAIAVVLATVLILSSEYFTKIFAVNSIAAEEFIAIIFWHSLALLILFPALICESAIKGLERFGVVRSAEIISTIAFAVSVMLMLLFRAPYYYVVYAYLLVYCARSLFYIYYITRTSSSIRLSVKGYDREILRQVISHAFTIFQGKSVSVVFNNISHVLIGILYGLYLVGVYDALMRLPRFVKMIFGLINSAILPASAKLEATGDRDSMQLLLKNGSLFTVSLSLPFVSGLILFSDQIISLWLGIKHIDQAQWLGFFFLWPLIVSISSLGAAMLVARKSALSVLNKITLLQLVLFLSIAVFMGNIFGFYSYIIGTVVSVLCVLPLQLKVISEEYSVRGSFYYFMLGRGALCLLPSLLWYFLVSYYFDQIGIIYVIIGLSGWCIIYFFTIYNFVYTPVQKAYVRNSVNVFKS